MELFLRSLSSRGRGGKFSKFPSRRKSTLGARCGVERVFLGTPAAGRHWFRHLPAAARCSSSVRRPLRLVGLCCQVVVPEIWIRCGEIPRNWPVSSFSRPLPSPAPSPEKVSPEKGVSWTVAHSCCVPSPICRLQQWLLWVPAVGDSGSLPGSCSRVNSR